MAHKITHIPKVSKTKLAQEMREGKPIDRQPQKPYVNELDATDPINLPK